MRTYNRRETKDTYNVIGIMKGEIEPGMYGEILFLHEMELFAYSDRYVVIGNHR